MSAPLLGPRDLEEELRRIFQFRHRSWAAAIYGAGEEGNGHATVSVEIEADTRTFLIRTARSELELRIALSEAAAMESPLCVLVDWDTGKLPLDVAGRLAGGQIHYVQPGRRLARLLGAAAASWDVLTCAPLRDAILAEPPSAAGRLDGGGNTVDLERAWRWLLAKRTGLDPQGALSPERWLAFIAASAEGARFAAYLAERNGLQAELEGYLERTVSPVAPLGLQAWLAGHGRKAAALTFLLDAAVGVLDENGYLRASLESLLAGFVPGWRGLVTTGRAKLAQWAALARPLALRLDQEHVRALCREAEALVASDEARLALRNSTWLPRAYQAAQETLAGELDGAAASVDAALLTRVRVAFDRLRRHDLAEGEGGQYVLERARMAVRLVAYLASRDESTLVGSASREQVRLLAEHFVSDGAFVDHARRVARGSTNDALGKAIDGLVARVDAVRDADDERFARELAAWYEGGRQAPGNAGPWPIERALAALGAKFLEDDRDRRLLVILMDGMSWANAVELLESLERQRWGVLRYHGGRALTPVLAALPTITDVSRSAFFAGKLIPPGGATTTAKDPERFAAHAKLIELGGGEPQLLLRADLQTSGGEASPEALQLIQSDRRVVGVVVNAIDESLKAGRQIRIITKYETIRPLPALLKAAADAGRAVLLASDHGHVTGARVGAAPAAVMPASSTGLAGARRRELAEGEEARPNEVVFTSDLVWRKQRKHRMALLYRETDANGNASHEGEHGGASLAEVVAPALLIGAAELAERAQAERVGGDPALEIMPLERPRWWDAERASASTPRAVVVAEPPPQRPTKVKPDSPQLVIPALATPPPVTVPPNVIAAAAAGGTAAASPWRARLAKVLSDVQESTREKALRAVDILAAHGGRMPVDVFAVRMQEMPFRVGGLVSVLSECLTYDGYKVLAHDVPGKQVVLNIAILEDWLKGSA